MSTSRTQFVKQVGLYRKKRTVWAVAILVVFVFTVFAAGFVVAYNYVVNSYNEQYSEEEINIDPEKGMVVEIPMGSSTSDIAAILKKEGVIKYPLLFRILSNINGYDGLYKSGVHVVDKNLDYVKLMKILSSNPKSIKVTIPEGYTYKQIVDTLASKKLVDRNKFDEIAQNEPFDFIFVKDIPSRANRLEGYLFPDTYEFDMKTGEKEIINRMLKNFDAKFPTRYYDQIKRLKNMTVDKVIILASIVEREAKLPEERSLIAGVFYNRLNSKDPELRKLQSCATIQYIYYQKTGVLKEKITEEDTKIKDPYNTYENEGLPPGPICSPGKSSIEAVLYPNIETGYLYFCAKGDGSNGHYFSKTFEEHLAAMKKYGVK